LAFLPVRVFNSVNETVTGSTTHLPIRLGGKKGLQFRPRASDAPRDGCDGSRHSDHVWSIEEIVGLL
jgi:hypothetical protein